MEWAEWLVLGQLHSFCTTFGLHFNRGQCLSTRPSEKLTEEAVTAHRFCLPVQPHPSICDFLKKNADRPGRMISKQAFLSKACLTHQHLPYLTLLYNTFGPQFIPSYHLEPFYKCCCFADKRLQCFERAVHRNFTRMASVK